jgi:hypothetical protein
MRARGIIMLVALQTLAEQMQLSERELEQRKS